MALYKYIKKTRNSPEFKDVQKAHLIEWRKEPITVRIERPTKLDRARTLGYRAKPGFILIRQKVEKNTRKRESFAGGRRPKHNRRVEIINTSYQAIAERRVNDKFRNLEVLNSYFVGKDGKYKWYEVILVDPNHPQIINDSILSWISSPKHTRRAFRGLTSAGKKSKMDPKK
ncbi:MAG: 50S ribosomal protein L15e [Candidatus Nanoarchaeia archaeon]|nr:50S ribosomal protein L15e [Candidatus Nanoarchaeia archaeon]